MTKNVLVTISGLHYDDSVMMVQEENSNEANSIEVTTPATYYLKNGKHYIVYDEVVEGIPGTIKNRIKIDEGKLLDITKSGITNSHMVFETDKINVTPYQTPYGDLLLGTYTKGMDIRRIKNEYKKGAVKNSLFFWILFFMLYFLSFLNLAKNPFFFSGVSSAPRTPLTPVM